MHGFTCLHTHWLVHRRIALSLFLHTTREYPSYARRLWTPRWASRRRAYILDRSFDTHLTLALALALALTLAYPYVYGPLEVTLMRYRSLQVIRSDLW